MAGWRAGLASGILLVGVTGAGGPGSAELELVSHTLLETINQQSYDCTRAEQHRLSHALGRKTAWANLPPLLDYSNTGGTDIKMGC